jgi:hypothetical protein
MKKPEFVEIIQDEFEADLGRNHADERFEHAYKKKDGHPCLAVKDEESGRKFFIDLSAEYGDGVLTKQQVRELYRTSIRTRLYQALSMEAPSAGQESGAGDQGHDAPAGQGEAWLDAWLSAAEEHDTDLMEELMGQIQQALERSYANLNFSGTDDPWVLRCTSNDNEILPPLRLNFGRLEASMESLRDAVAWDNAVSGVLASVDRFLCSRMEQEHGSIFIPCRSVPCYKAFDDHGQITRRFLDHMGHARTEEETGAHAAWAADLGDLDELTVGRIQNGNTVILSHDGYPGAACLQDIQNAITLAAMDCPPEGRRGMTPGSIRMNTYFFPFSKYVTEIVFGVEDPEQYLALMKQKYEMTPVWERQADTIFQYDVNERSFRMVSPEYFLSHATRLEPEPGLEGGQDTEEEVELDIEL